MGEWAGFDFRDQRFGGDKGEFNIGGPPIVRYALARRRRRADRSTSEVSVESSVRREGPRVFRVCGRALLRSGLFGNFGF